MVILDKEQKEILLPLFEKKSFEGWKNIANELLNHEVCIVAGTECIWKGGVGNFIKTKSADHLIDCLEYTLDRETFIESMMVQNYIHNQLSDLELEIDRLRSTSNSIENLIK